MTTSVGGASKNFLWLDWCLISKSFASGCWMPIIFSVIFRIYSVMLSICCVMGIISSVRVIIHFVIFTISIAVLWISCLWFIIQPIPTVILKLLFHPHDSLGHSYNSVCDVQNCFCDPHYFFCHPSYYANELPVFQLWCQQYLLLS